MPYYCTRNLENGHSIVQFDDSNEDTIDFQRWNEYLVDGYKILGKNMPTQDTRFLRFYRRWVRENDREPGPDDIVYEVKGQSQDTVLDIKPVDPKDRDERIGYPTQKPESLLERIILASSSEGDIVGDFFVGRGTTAAVAQRLGRRWIACDQSRVAVAVTAERLKQQALTQGMADTPIPDFTVEQWGIYEGGAAVGYAAGAVPRFRAAGLWGYPHRPERRRPAHSRLAQSVPHLGWGRTTEISGHGGRCE